MWKRIFVKNVAISVCHCVGLKWKGVGGEVDVRAVPRGTSMSVEYSGIPGGKISPPSPPLPLVLRLPNPRVLAWGTQADYMRGPGKGKEGSWEGGRLIAVAPSFGKTEKENQSWGIYIYKIKKREVKTNIGIKNGEWVLTQKRLEMEEKIEERWPKLIVLLWRC